MGYRTRSRWIRVACCTVAVGLALICPYTSSAGVPQQVRVEERRQSFNDHWQFIRSDASGAQRPEFDDSQWTALRLPHDWAIDGPFESTLNPQTGALPISGVAWYRKTFP